MALPENPGLAVSGGTHIVLLALALVSFSRVPQPGGAQASIPIAIVSNEQFNEIAKGDKTAAQVNPRQPSEKITEATEPEPEPSTANAAKEVPQPAPAEAAKPRPLQQSATMLAARLGKESQEPAPKEVSTAKESAPLAVMPPAHKDAEHAAVKTVSPKPAADAAKKPDRAFRPDQVARLLDQERQKEKQAPASRVTPGEGAKEPQHKFDLGDIAKFLGKEEPQRKQASGHERTQFASLGSPGASAAKMSPSLWDQLDGLLQEQYKRCWNLGGLAGQQKYIPEIHVQYAPDGALIGEPELLNPPPDPSLRALAESAMRAVRRCDPLQIPAQYQPYYDQWKGRIVRFDPEEML
jgi:colicin import membrane protein